MAKQINFIDVGVGVGMIGVGLFFASPADEAVFTVGTGGVGAVASPVQVPITAGFGLALAYAGLTKVMDELD